MESPLDRFPVLPVRNTVLFPNTVVPLAVGRERSRRAVREAQERGGRILVVAQRDGANEDPTPEELFDVGVVAVITKVQPSDAENFHVVVHGSHRMRVSQWRNSELWLEAEGTAIAEQRIPGSPRAEVFAEQLRKLGKQVAALSPAPGAEALGRLFHDVTDPAHIADLASSILTLPVSERQELLELDRLEVRLEKLMELLARERERMLLQNELQAKLMDRLSKDQRDQLLREQLKTIHEELSGDKNVVAEFERKFAEAGLSGEALRVAREELARLEVVPRTSPEHHILRGYLEVLASLPWNRTSSPSADQIDLRAIAAILDEDHYGLEEPKNRFLEHAAVQRLRSSGHTGKVLCLLGPPGVGKTSFAKSVARALGRKFTRVALGGVRDEAEIRGHRRTYVGAMPGRLLQGIRRAGVRDPVVLLDEIDKVGNDFRGDPASALLEALDPEQNNGFLDHYVDVPFDLSSVFFVVTANALDPIPPALRDRLEILELSSYPRSEKIAIARRYLVPKLLEETGLSADQLTIDDAALAVVVEGYTREAGVRDLRRTLEKLFRRAARAVVEGTATAVAYRADNLSEVLGARKYSDRPPAIARPGRALALAWTPYGGETLIVEASELPGRGQLTLTGRLGDVMQESARIALSLARVRLEKILGRNAGRLDVHVHVPEGATPKDGPSAGVAIFSALVSLWIGRPPRDGVAITGEVSLSGLVLPVGGIKEKVIAAARYKAHTVCLPRQNERDLREVPKEVRDALKFVFLDDVDDALRALDLVPVPTPPSRQAMLFPEARA